MRTRFPSLLISAGLATATLLSAAPSALAQEGTRRGPPPAAPPRQPVNFEGGPREAPPPPRDERHDRRDGYVWVTGRWDWKRREHKWDWVAGHYERERAGKRWRDARWDRRGDEWVLVDGDWIDGSVVVSTQPNIAPPALRDERPGTRPGFIWARGKWAWQNGNWQWIPGRWEKARATQRWTEGRWELRGDHWEWIEGGWAEIPAYPPLDQPPPPPRQDNVRQDPGTIVLPGHWAWVEGQYVWKPAVRSRLQPGFHFVEGQWLVRDGHWGWTNGSWVPDETGTRSPPFNPGPTRSPPFNPYPPGTSGPTSAPPAPREERVEARDGYIWARGHHEWRGNQYEWVPGHWERQMARQTWTDGRWEQRGNVWVYVEGGWH